MALSPKHPGYGFGGPIPGGNIKPVPYKSQAVEFPIGTCLQQTSTPLLNTQALTISVFFEIPGTLPNYSSGSLFSLFEIFDPNTGNHFAAISVQSRFTGSGYEAPTILLEMTGTDPFMTVGGGIFSTLNPSFGDWHHLFASVDLSGTGAIPAPPGFPGEVIFPASILLDGVVCGQGYVPSSGAALTPGYVMFGGESIAPITLPINGFPAGLPAIASELGDLPVTRARRYSNFQAWFGKYIDPLAVSGTGSIYDRTRTDPPANADNDVDPVLLGQLVLALIPAGVDPTFGLTVANVECEYFPSYDNTAARGGLFELESAEITTAFNAIGKTPDSSGFTGNDNQTKAFVYYSLGPWSDTALQQFGSDPTGIYRYTVHNQGTTGAPTIWNAVANNPNALIGSFTLGQQARMIPGIPIGGGRLSTGQSWSNGGVNNRWGLTTKLTAADKVQTWLDNLTFAWGIASADAAGRLIGVTNQNINAFLSQSGLQVPPETAAALFGQPDLLFNGDKDPTFGFPHNDGVDGAFTLVNGPLLDVPGPP